MLNNRTFPELPDLSTIEFSNTRDVRTLIKERCHHLFGSQVDCFIDEYMDTIEELFTGRWPDYQAMDTAYHDISHTSQATLCLVDLLHNRHFSEAKPRISALDFKRAVVAILYHDIGYLKLKGDNEGSGAKYTHLHEQRSCNIAREVLFRQGWSDDDILFVENLISATGPTADVTKVPFRSQIERVLGQAVCTADFIGQMSDPHYPDKLVVLFDEFKESYRYQKIPETKWFFKSYEELLVKTPKFWSTFVQHKLTVECEGMLHFLEHPVTGKNPYLESIERNLDTIDERIANSVG
jgi:hypothetical protein